MKRHYIVFDLNYCVFLPPEVVSGAKVFHTSCHNSKSEFGQAGNTTIP